MKSPSNRKLSLWLIILLAGFPQLSETIYSPALPAVTMSLQTSNYLVQWTLSIYFFGFALGVLIWGQASDHIGRRFAMLFGIIVYLFGSLLCLLSPSIIYLLIARMLQAFGASVGSVITQIMVREYFMATERGRVFSSVAVALSFAPAIGPVMGGVLSDYLGWRSNFLALSVMALVILVLSFFSLPETLNLNVNNKNKKISLSQVFKRLITDQHVITSACFIGITNAFTFCFYAEGPFIFINHIGLSRRGYGLLGLFIAAAAILGGGAYRSLQTRLTDEKIIYLGVLISFIGSAFMLSALALHLVGKNNALISILAIMLPFMLISFGSFGLVIPIVLSKALVQYQDCLGRAGALFGLMYYLILSVLTWIMGWLHNHTLWPMPSYFLALSFIMLIMFKMSLKNREKRELCVLQTE
ncbi:hypothetical protein AVM71_07485 [Piscirickettsia salmonis]|nr:hypothetical protein AVM71_07485 [Piscirickettsia salmonis]